MRTTSFGSGPVRKAASTVTKDASGAALQRFKAGLKEALARLGQDDRTAARLAVRAALEFVYAHPDFTAEGLSRPLFELLAALDDLGKGRVAPMLRPISFANRHPDAATRKEARGHAIFCIDLLVASGMTVTEASRDVAKVWNAHLTPGSAEAAWRTVRDWYRRAADVPVGDPQRIVLDTLRKEIPTRTPSSREHALVLLRLALSTVRLTNISE
jgi:hypothetical protein